MVLAFLYNILGSLQMLNEEQKSKVIKEAKVGYLPLSVLGPLEQESSKLWPAARQRAVCEGDNEEGCVYSYLPKDTQRMSELNADIREVMRLWESVIYSR